LLSVGRSSFNFSRQHCESRENVSSRCSTGPKTNTFPKLYGKEIRLGSQPCIHLA
jgi:hypothetical protein